MSDLSATEDFLDHYQLQHDPFAARTPGFRFFTPKRKPVLAQLHHMAHFSEQVQVVVGPSGAGKTLLRQALVASCNKENVQCIVTSGREVADASTLARFICQALNVADTKALLERADQLHLTGMQLYLVVDDAHCLDGEAVQLLADLSQSGGRAAPRVFLFADETVAGLLEVVDMPADRVWLQLIDLAPFTLEETRDYLSQRLETAGQGIELLDDEQIRHIYQQSSGWPGEINQAARQTMVEAIEPAGPVERKKGTALPLRSLVALVLVGTGVAIAWMMGGDEPEPTRTVLSLPDQVATVDVTDAGVAGPILQMPNDAGNMLERIAEEPDAEPLGTTVANSGPAPEDAGALTQEPAISGTAANANDLPEPIAMPEPLPVEAPPVVAAPEPAVKPEAAAPVAAPAPAPAVTARKAGAYHQADWYRQRATSEYALQLLGSRSRQAALDFIGAQTGVADLGYFETLHEGKPWFVVTQGAYAGRSQAQQGAARLPESLRKLKPWPRSIGSIQQSLR
ncbi:DamX protein [Halopseudomonas litoralis]|uniref:DamX protein n=1 Tax=Halopseudomonas litoralis TaxID=797277 RepID=A0A1H1V9H0_9GAMM|nr:AAA family ATPase [Halopseudomonas litoralis]SDS81313.1 DamX protein [Halopseudomonas litoralis]